MCVTYLSKNTKVDNEFLKDIIKTDDDNFTTIKTKFDLAIKYFFRYF